ncbi:MAG TPA: dihydrofolate reductase [Rhodopseudomonas sp.]|uniref:dihydrofolate reductase n=1 Tax=Rhodopseudomonas sp. TaxID=1078 RepID=UPI002ED8C58D
MPSISFVVARSWPSHIIGCDNKLPWHLRSDLQRFRKITLGHVVLMGRNTFDSIGRPLPGRVNIILSKRPANDQESNIWNRSDTSLIWSRSREDAMYLADILSLAAGLKEFFVIGGEQMYELFAELGNRIHLTEVFTQLPREAGDSHFDQEFDGRKWRATQEEEIPAGPNDEYPSRYTIYDRRIKTVRYVELEDYFTSSENQETWVAGQYERVKNSIVRGVVPKREHQFHLFEEFDSSV